MIEADIETQIGAIHGSAHKLVLEFAGAGSMALFWLHAVPGSSRTVLEATDRYAATSMADLLGAPPGQAVSEPTAAAMAAAAYRRARRLAEPGVACLGVGCTAALVTDRARRGEDRVWLAVRDEQSIATYGLVLARGQRDRLGEEAVVSRLLIHAIAEASGCAAPLALGLLPGEQVASARAPLPDPIGMLLAGAARTVGVAPGGALVADAAPPGALLSGSFNPLHAGHERLAQAAGAALGIPITFELPILNADKAPLSYAEIERRLAQFRWRYPVVLSRAALFVEKAGLYPGCVFVVGYDTAERLVEPRYYGGEAARDAALARIRAQGCRFLVAGRLEDGTFRTLRDIAVPPGARDLFAELPEAAFRVDLSSTAIRQAQAS
ncbi:hypothetical protein [Kouleothrix sp.]|uniref:hypothetical protein n=1 Tax=Kouleothrix sp. TaxID=2779161 RepID=UPI003919E589